MTSAVTSVSNALEGATGSGNGGGAGGSGTSEASGDGFEAAASGCAFTVSTPFVPFSASFFSAAVG
mgnify:CR=1 FL=1